MKTLFISAVFIFSIGACNPTAQKRGGPVDRSKSAKQVVGKKFFDYDAIDYYATEYDEIKIGDLFNNQARSEMDSFKMGVIVGQIPKGVTDLAFIDKLAAIGYSKTALDKSKFDAIDEIFAEKTVPESIFTGCIYVYRDILIFKKNSKVVGTAKVCFGCMAKQIHGTSANTEDFGQDGDYGRLMKLLR